MKVLSLELDMEKLNLTAPEDKQRTSQDIIKSVIENVIVSYGQQQRGLDEKERRQYYKIADKLDEAATTKAATIDLDDEYMGFIKKCFRECKLMPNPLLRQIEDILTNVKER